MPCLLCSEMTPALLLNCSCVAALGLGGPGSLVESPLLPSGSYTPLYHIQHRLVQYMQRRRGLQQNLELKFPHFRQI